MSSTFGVGHVAHGIGEWAGGVDDDLGLQGEFFAALDVARDDAVHQAVRVFGQTRHLACS